jgi:hypothetical protein
VKHRQTNVSTKRLKRNSAKRDGSKDMVSGQRRNRRFNELLTLH